MATIVAALTLCGVAVAGCGGGDDNKSSGGGGGGGNPVSGGANKQAVASCKQSVANAPSLKADIKKDLENICEKAGNGDENAVRKATKEVCIKIVEQSAPAGPARDQAKKACNAAQTGKVPSY